MTLMFNARLPAGRCQPRLPAEAKQSSKLVDQASDRSDRSDLTTVLRGDLRGDLHVMFMSTLSFTASLPMKGRDGQGPQVALFFSIVGGVPT